MPECPCQSPASVEGTPIENLEKVRELCSALRHVYLPDDVWPDVKAWHSTPDPVALHHSVFALALERGHLARLTNPIHRYLLQDGAVAAGLRTQYREDLKERWMLHADHRRRHQLCRIYLGRITELQVAEWLESQGWTITELEARSGMVPTRRRVIHPRATLISRSRWSEPRMPTLNRL